MVISTGETLFLMEILTGLENKSMGTREIEMQELAQIVAALSHQKKLCSYFGQMDKTQPAVKEFYENLLKQAKITYANEHFFHEWSSIDLHVVNQLWGSTACGWGGMGGAAMTNAFTTVLENKNMKMSFVYWNGKLAYVVQIDEKYTEFVTKRGYHFPQLSRVSEILTVIYKDTRG